MKYIGPSFDLKTVMKTANLSEQTQKHLTRVYAMLMATVFAAFVGAWTCMNLIEVSSGTATIGAFGGLALILAMACTNKRNTSIRIGLMLAFGFAEGISISPLLKTASIVDERIIATGIFVSKRESSLGWSVSKHFLFRSLLGNCHHLLLLFRSCSDVETAFLLVFGRHSWICADDSLLE